MTPLAQRIVKQLTLPVKQRTIVDHGQLLSHMSDTHYFDATAVDDLVIQTTHLMAEDQIDPGRSFLPAPRTFIEVTRSACRIGYHLEQKGGLIAIAVATELLGGEHKGALYTEPLGLWRPDTMMLTSRSTYMKEDEGRHLGRVAAMLAIINTPRLIGRKQHMPHRGLERALVRAQPLVGKFPLHAWTELTLSVSAMMKEADGTVHEAHLTGEKCLHFCRAHLRVRNGRLEQVKAHWRGNPALGMKRTRYRLAA